MTANIATSAQNECATAAAMSAAARTQQASGEEREPRVAAVDQDAGLRLQQCRGTVEHREGEAEFGVADAVVRLDDGEQRRQHQHVEVADAVRGAHARDQAKVIGAAVVETNV